MPHPSIALSAPTFNWHRTREDLALAGLRKINEIGVGEPPNSESTDLALNALDGVLKMLQFQGLQWPQISPGHIELTLVKGQQKNLLPSDYYGFAEIQFRNQQANTATGLPPDSPGPLIPLILLNASEWADIPIKTQTADFPRNGFIDNRNVLWVFPVPTQNIEIEMFYQKVIADSRPGASPQLRAPWALALPYGIACELSEEFEISDAKIKRLEQKWAYYRELCLMNETEQTHFNPSVADDLQFSRRSNSEFRNP